MFSKGSAWMHTCQFSLDRDTDNCETSLSEHAGPFSYLHVSRKILSSAGAQGCGLLPWLHLRASSSSCQRQHSIPPLHMPDWSAFVMVKLMVNGFCGTTHFSQTSKHRARSKPEQRFKISFVILRTSAQGGFELQICSCFETDKFAIHIFQPSMK